MRLMKRRPRPATRERVRTSKRAPSFRELRARLRTEKAEAKLLETEIRIHQEAERIRQEIRTQ
jgi:hypothetical protein